MVKYKNKMPIAGTVKKVLASDKFQPDQPILQFDRNDIDDGEKKAALEQAEAEKKRELIVSGFFGNLWIASLLSGLLFPIFFRKKWGKMEAIVGDYVSNRWGS